MPQETISNIAAAAKQVLDDYTASMPVGQAAQRPTSFALLSAATGNVTPVGLRVTGYSGKLYLDLQKTGTGTCTVTINGSMDNVTFYVVGFQPIDNQATLTRTVTPIAVAAGNPTNHLYQILDTAYNFYQAVISATAGAISVTGTLWATPI